MRISVVTTSYNSSATIRDTMQSVREQDYQDVEYIIVDGGSSDGTMDIVSQFDDVVSTSISEPDNGIYDALNKGIRLATGDVIGFLHSDDLFADSKIITEIAEVFEDQSIDAVYGDLDYVLRDNPDTIHRKWRSQEFSLGLFKKGWMPAHPTFYLRKKHYDRFGRYDTSFRQSADYELMLRMLEKHQLKASYIPKVLVKMRLGGASNVSLGNRWRANQEDARAWKKNGLKPGLLTRFLKPFSKLGQFT